MWLGSLADRPKRNAGVCSQPVAAHTEGGKRWAQHGAGGEAGRRESRGRGSVEQERCGAVGQTWEQNGLSEIWTGRRKQKQDAVWKKQARMTRETSFETQTLNCAGERGKEKPGNCDSKMELKVAVGRKSDTSLRRNQKGAWVGLNAPRPQFSKAHKWFEATSFGRCTCSLKVNASVVHWLATSCSTILQETYWKTRGKSEQKCTISSWDKELPVPKLGGLRWRILLKTLKDYLFSKGRCS